MKFKSMLSGLLLGIAVYLPAQSTKLFQDEQVAAIYLELPADSLDFLIDQLVNDHYLHARFVFDDGQQRDTVEDVGLRLRGNTSLLAQKKSFKISFNAFEPGREYQGVRKLNLNGEHNDPTLIREKLFYEVWKKAGMPERRTAFVRLFINGAYRGLYTNVEEIDKQWLTRAYGNNEGNLFKCTWPADLVYLGSDEQAYKSILNNPATRAYDLTTNEAEDDYARLVALITTLHQPSDAVFPDAIRQILNVDAALKAFAIDVATGNWDDYFFNKNNYYLYDNPLTGRFEFVTYDTDNTFGVDWTGNQDWARRDALFWYYAGEPRPLATKLLAVPEFKEKYLRYLDTLTRYITLPDSIFPRIEALHALIIPAAAQDTYRTLDFGYTLGDFHDGFEATVDGHTPYGIKPFLALRHDSSMAQIQGQLTPVKIPDKAGTALRVFPNPAADWFCIRSGWSEPGRTVSATLYDFTGKWMGERTWQAGQEPFIWQTGDLPPGIYALRMGAQVTKVRIGR